MIQRNHPDTPTQAELTMKIIPSRWLYRVLKAVSYGTVGALLVLLVVGVLYLNGRPDLSVWHTVDLDQEFTTRSEVTDFAGYLALEQRLFEQLDRQVYRDDEQRSGLIDRYVRGSLSDPGRWSPNWNRSFELKSASPRGAVLLLHGMSDSPYSLRALGQTLHDQGYSVLGLRLPGHGTAPSGLVELRWQDMAAAVRLAVKHLKEQVGDLPLYLVGYSNGAALAVHYALSTLQRPELPKSDGLVLISPAIGVTPAAAFAVWQARLGHLLGLDKLAWNSILPEYDPFKYNSFAVNAGDQVYRLTSEIQSQIDALNDSGELAQFPPLLAFQSAVDATVSTGALIEGLFSRLPPTSNESRHELVLFDIDREAIIAPIIKDGVVADVVSLLRDTPRNYVLSVVTNEHTDSRQVEVISQVPGAAAPRHLDPGLQWPRGLYSLAHVALPFAPDDPVYAQHPGRPSPGISLGNMALRGERGVLRISASELLRLRWNPFYSYLERRALGFIGGAEATALGAAR